MGHIDTIHVIISRILHLALIRRVDQILKGFFYIIVSYALTVSIKKNGSHRISKHTSGI